MNELVVIGEGETEQTFVRDQLAGHLALHGTAVWAVLPGRHRKRVHGPIVTKRIGLEVLREKCDHFASWLTRLENIGVE